MVNQVVFDTQTIVSGKPVWFQKGHAETLKTLSLDRLYGCY